MKDFYTEVELNGKKHLLCFDLNVMKQFRQNMERLINGLA